MVIELAEQKKKISAKRGQQEGTKSTEYLNIAGNKDTSYL